MGIRYSEWSTDRDRDLRFRFSMEMGEDSVCPDKIDVDVFLESDAENLKTFCIDEPGETKYFNFSFSNGQTIKGHLETYRTCEQIADNLFCIWGVFNYGGLCFNEALYNSGTSFTEDGDSGADTVDENGLIEEAEEVKDAEEELISGLRAQREPGELLDCIVPEQITRLCPVSTVSLEELIGKESEFLKPSDSAELTVDYIRGLPDNRFTEVSCPEEQLKPPFDKFYSIYEDSVQLIVRRGRVVLNEIEQNLKEQAQKLDFTKKEYRDTLTFYGSSYIYSSVKCRAATALNLGKILLMAWLLEKGWGDDLFTALFSTSLLLPEQIQAEMPEKISAERLGSQIVLKHKVTGYRPGDLAHIENLAAGEKLIEVSSTGEELDRVDELLLERRESGTVSVDTDLKAVVEKSVRTGALDSLKTDYSGFKTGYGPPAAVTLDGSWTVSREEKEPENRSASSLVRSVIERSISNSGEVNSVLRKEFLRRWKRRECTRELENSTSSNRSIKYYWLDKVYEVKSILKGRGLLCEMQVDNPLNEIYDSYRDIIQGKVLEKEEWQGLPEGISSEVTSRLPEQSVYITELLLPGEMKSISVPEGYSCVAADISFKDKSDSMVVTGAVGGQVFSVKSGESSSLKLKGNSADISAYASISEENAVSVTALTIRCNINRDYFISSLKNAVECCGGNTLLEKYLLNRIDAKAFNRLVSAEVFKNLISIGGTGAGAEEYLKDLTGWSIMEYSCFNSDMLPVNYEDGDGCYRDIKTVRIYLSVRADRSRGFLFYIRTGVIPGKSEQFVPIIKKDSALLGALCKVSGAEAVEADVWEISLPVDLMQIEE